METAKYIHEETSEVINVPECIVYSVGYPVACEDLQSAFAYADAESKKPYNKDTRYYVVTLTSFYCIGYSQRGKWYGKSIALKQPDINKRIKAKQGK